MKTEKIIISFIAVVVGIIAAGIAFYFYQSTKTITPPKTTTTPVAKTPTPTEDNSFFLTLDVPKDEDVVEKKTITVSGKTIPEATVIISTQISDEVVSPSRTGNFTTTITIENGTNLIEVIAIAPDGRDKKEIRTITYSTESF